MLVLGWFATNPAGRAEDVADVLGVSVVVVDGLMADLALTSLAGEPPYGTRAADARVR
jgi:hypothetical protein